MPERPGRAGLTGRVRSPFHPKEQRMLQAVQSFSVGRRHVAKGQLVAADDPIVKGRESLFRSVESATAPAPQRRRARVRATVPEPVLDPPSVED